MPQAEPSPAQGRAPPTTQDVSPHFLLKLPLGTVCPWPASGPWHTLSTSDVTYVTRWLSVHSSGPLLIALGVLKVGLDHGPF